MAFSEKRRFIAGAVCPRCKRMDSIRAYSENGTDYRECIHCGFSDQIRINPPVREPETRVNRSEEERAAQEQVVKILPAKE